MNGYIFKRVFTLVLVFVIAGFLTFHSQDMIFISSPQPKHSENAFFQFLANSSWLTDNKSARIHVQTDEKMVEFNASDLVLPKFLPNFVVPPRYLPNLAKNLPASHPGLVAGNTCFCPILKNNKFGFTTDTTRHAFNRECNRHICGASQRWKNEFKKQQFGFIY